MHAAQLLRRKSLPRRSGATNLGRDAFHMASRGDDAVGRLRMIAGVMTQEKRIVVEQRHVGCLFIVTCSDTYCLPTHHKCLKVRMKISPLEIASEEFVDSPPPRELVAISSYFG